MEYQQAFSEPINRPHRSVSIKLSDAVTGTSEVSGKTIAPIVSHEVGHYFNLLHTFETTLGDAGASCPESIGSAENGDLIEDTYPEPDPQVSQTGSVYQGSSLLKANLGSPAPIPYNMCQSGDFRPIRDLLESYNSRNYMTYNMEFLHQDTLTLAQALRVRNQWSLYLRSELGGERVAVTNTNVNNELNLGGTYSVVDESASGIASGNPYVFQENQSHTLKTDAERLSSLKHFNWNGSFVNFGLSVSMSHPSTEAIVRQKAYFNGLATAELRALAIDGGHGQIGMRDPWYLHSDGTQPNTFFSFTSPYTVTGAYNQQSGGVFLDQTVQSGTYYRVRASEPQTVNNVQWIFTGWSSTNVDLTAPTYHSGGYYETPAIFRSGASREVTANYKAHLASSSSSVLANNGQRRLVQNADGSESMVAYESAGEIWVSVNTGSGFGTESRISGGDGSNELPALTGDATHRFVVWRHNNGGGSYTIRFRACLSGTWQSIQSIGSGDGSAIPLVTVKSNSGNKDVYVVYQEDASEFRTLKLTNCWQTWVDCGATSGSVAGGSLSALESDSYGNSTMALCSPDGADILYREYTSSWSAAQTVPGSGSVGYWGLGYFSFATANSPQVLRYDGRTYVVWNHAQEYWTEEWPYVIAVSHKVYVERDSYGNWSSAVAFLSWDEQQSQQDASAPTLAVMSSGNTVLEWPYFGTIQRAVGSGEYWSVSSEGTGTDLQLAPAPGYKSSYATRMHMAQAGSLYSLVPLSPFAARTTTTLDKRLPLEYSRVLSVLDTATGASYAIEISQPRIGDHRLAFTAVNDTLPAIGAENFFSFLATDSSSAGSELDTISFDVAIMSKGWGKLQKFDLSILLSANVLAGIVETDGIESTRRLSVRMPVGANTEKTLRLVPMGNLPVRATGLMYQLTHVYRPKYDQKNHSTKRVAQEALKQSVPLATGLYQNYPNPFNPETSVNFTLESAGHVRLAVYDLLGREVAVLFDGHASVGTHVAKWNAEQHPSGTYVCRLQATTEGGRSFIQTVRMQYLR